MSFTDDIAVRLDALQTRADLLEIAGTMDAARREIAYAQKPARDREAIRTHLATIETERRAAHRALDRQETAGVTSLDVLTAQHHDRKSS